MSTTVGKKELVAAIAEKAAITKKDAAIAFDALVGAVQEEIAEGNDVSIMGLVSFTQKVVPAHERFLGFSGETVSVPERVHVKAKASKTL